MNKEKFVCDPNDIDCCLNCVYDDCICSAERMRTVYYRKSEEEKEKERKKSYMQKYQKQYRDKKNGTQKEMLLAVIKTELEMRSPSISDLVELTGLPNGTVARIVCELIEERKLQVIEG